MKKYDSDAISNFFEVIWKEIYAVAYISFKMASWLLIVGAFRAIAIITHSSLMKILSTYITVIYNIALVAFVFYGLTRRHSYVSKWPSIIIRFALLPLFITCMIFLQGFSFDALLDAIRSPK